MANPETWPELPLAAWRGTRDTLHMWMQIVGKIRLAQAPPVNHWWQVPLYVTARGLTTSPIPYGERVFQIGFDFIDHRLTIATGEGASDGFALRPLAVADFYAEIMERLRGLGLDIRIWTMPVEIPDPVPFEEDRAHAAYDPDYAQRFWRILVQADRVLTTFRGRFLGKASPVHFFWGSFDLAVTRFSGGAAPPHPGAPGVADRVTREAYSHEVSSCGFWPGGAGLDEPVFYSYAYPQPAGFADAPVRPAAAFWSRDFSEFILPYDAVRRARSTRRRAARVSRKHIRSRRQLGAMGPRGTRTRGREVNLFARLPGAAAAEAVDELLARPGLRIERIVSHGQASPPGFWYDQEEGEWVLLLAGAARLRFADEREPCRLAPGDCIDIAPHRRHRIEWTDPAAATLWLAVFYRAE